MVMMVIMVEVTTIARRNCTPGLWANFRILSQALDQFFAFWPYKTKVFLHFPLFSHLFSPSSPPGPRAEVCPDGLRKMRKKRKMQ